MPKGLARATKSGGKTGGRGVNSGRGRKAARKAVAKKKLQGSARKVTKSVKTTKPVVSTTTTSRANVARNTLAATRRRVDVSKYRIAGSSPLN